MDRTLNIVLLLAGGQGHRMHSCCPKQFMEVADAPVILHTMQVFQQHAGIDHIYVVCNPEWDKFVKNTARNGKIWKFSGTFPAGNTSIDSLRNGINGLCGIFGDRNPTIMTHEAVRPLVSGEMITLNLSTYYQYGNAVTAIRSHEAYMVSPNGVHSEKYIPRELLYRAQSPITFSLKELTEAFQRADSIKVNRSQSLYTLITEVFPLKKLYISPGSELNFKLTHPEDIDTLKAILTYRQQQ